MRLFVEGKGSVEGVEKSEWDGAPCLLLRFTSDYKEARMLAYIDPETMQVLARVETFADGRERRNLYSNYQEVGGMLEPFLIESYLDDELQHRVIVEGGRANVGTMKELFELPDSLRGRLQL